MVHESKTNNVNFPYERKAMNGDKMPDGLEYPDQILYLCFRNLYAQLKRGDIDKESAVCEKRKLLQEYQCYQFREQMGKEWVDVIKMTELARAEYRKNRTLENADKLLACIEGGKSCG